MTTFPYQSLTVPEIEVLFRSSLGGAIDATYFASEPRGCMKVSLDADRVGYLAGRFTHEMGHAWDLHDATLDQRDELFRIITGLVPIHYNASTGGRVIPCPRTDYDVTPAIGWVGFGPPESRATDDAGELFAEAFLAIYAPTIEHFLPPTFAGRPVDAALLARIREVVGH